MIAHISTGRDVAIVCMFIAVAAIIGTCGYAAATRPHTIPTVG